MSARSPRSIRRRLGGVGVNVSKVAEVEEGASLVVRPRV